MARPILGEHLNTDGFDRADSATLGSTDQGKSWLKGSSGNYQIVSGKLKCTTASGGSDIATIDSGLRNFTTLQSLITMPSGGNGGLVFRAIDRSNLMGVRLSVTSGNILIFKTVADSITTLKTITHAFSADTAYRLRLRFFGARLKIFIDGQIVGQYHLTAGEQAFFLPTLTRVGVRTSSVANTTYDDFACLLIN